MELTKQRTSAILKRDEIIRWRKNLITERDSSFSNSHDVVLTSYIIFLAAKIAEIDLKNGNNKLANERKNNFLESFSIKDTNSNIINDLFNSALNENKSCEYCINLITNIYPFNSKIHFEICNKLFLFADINLNTSPEKIILLEKIFRDFKLGESKLYELIRNKIIKFDKNPFILLNISNRASYSDFKNAQRKIMNIYHPDRLMHYNIVPKFKKVLDEQYIIYSNAIEKIKKKRKFS